jgi:valyl-tRNA synthetase
MTKEQLSTTYEPQQVEKKWYSQWRSSGYFKAPDLKPGQGSAKGYFSIVMPPPNVTGSLHLGHAMDETMQDILTRFRRMQGYDTLWLPGTDHAGIATQAKVEEQLAKEGTNKYELGREKFVEQVWAWKDLYHGRITDQLGTLGSSCDWSRERFTLDEGCSKAVQEVFVKLYEKGLIYQGNYLINWCPKCQTTISDIEVEHEPESGHLWHLRYPIEELPGQYIVVATTRPETMLGDTAVAVHPDDARYTHLVGKHVRLPFMDRLIPIIADTMVDKEFGTGVVKITPAHDINDFETGLRHNLEQISVLDKEAKMNAQAGAYEGLDRFEARRKIVEDFKALGLLEKVEDHEHAVGHCYRCNTIIEPMISKQWFVKMKPLAEPAVAAVKEGRIRFVPSRFSKIYLNWMEEVRDWCISRQLWWGHRIPVWYCQDCGEVICRKEAPAHCPKCHGSKLEQDPDVLDTWFSSGLWPFSTLGWPEETDDLKAYYPTSVLVTGRDIIFFWVARMAFLGIEFMKEVPFRDVLIHGLILDAQGRKMSKSLGNGIDPIEVIEQYGADTLRFTLMTGNTPGNDLRFQKERLEGNRNFCNKIWNACRFAMMHLEDFDQPQARADEPSLADRWIRSRFTRCAQEVTAALEQYDMGAAAFRVYEFLWDELCDWYIEMIKPRLYGRETPGSRRRAQETLAATLRQTLELLHPFMPFITEELWQHFPGTGESIMLAPWPQADEAELDDVSEAEMALLMEVTKAARNLRSEVNVGPGKKADLVLLTDNEETKRMLEAGRDYLLGLASLQGLTIADTKSEKPAQAVTAVVRDIEVYLPLSGLIDLEKERQRLQKDAAKVEQEINAIAKKLANPGFTGKAPAEVIAKEEAKLADAQYRFKALQERLAAFGG